MDDIVNIPIEDLLGEDWYSENERADAQDRERTHEIQQSYLD